MIFVTPKPLTDREKIDYLNEENALIKEAAIRHRLRVRRAIDKLITTARDHNDIAMLTAMTKLKDSFNP
jgi:hypothetical protein